jgi:hypothetical protein
MLPLLMYSTVPFVSNIPAGCYLPLREKRDYKRAEWQVASCLCWLNSWSNDDIDVRNS